jgi:Ca2+-binding RTX toxin-like protein
VDLLSRVTDADGDRLSVSGLTVSEGTVSRIDDRTWLFTPAKDDVGQVEFAYTVTDGQATASATASVNIRELPGSTLFGTEGDDVLIGTPGSDFIYALGGDDVVVGREWSDVIEGGDGDDRLVGGDGDDVLDGGAGNDQLFGGAGNDVLYGRAGCDVLFGESGDDILLGGDGADWLNGGSGQDLLHGEAGDDRLEGGADNDYLDGGDGADQIAGDGGNDVLVGGKGADLLQGGDGADTFVATANDGDDSMVGGDGADTVDFGALSAPVTVDLDGGTATGADTGCDTITEIENVVGTAGGDVITGDEAANRITGAAGDDVLQGGDGDDTFVATANDGDDSMVGGDGSDTLDYSAIATPVVVDLEEGRASGAGIGTDQISEIENVIAGGGDDTLIADEAISTFVGGAGADVFVFRTAASAGSGSGSRDRIQDLDIGDRIDIKDISREFERAFGDVIDDQNIKKFVLVKDSDPFTRPGEIRIKYEDLADGRVTIIEGNIDFNSDTDFEIELVGDKLIDETYFRSGQD